MRKSFHSFIFSFFCFFILSFLPIGAHAQKVIDRSQKTRPDWYGVTKEDYLVVSAIGSDLETAKQKALTEIKLEILQSVAQNVEFSTETVIEQLTRNDEVQSNISMKQTGSTRIASLPYISGVSLSNATDSYWELQQERTTGEKTYVFCVLYPYSKAEYNAMKAQFEALDEKMVKTVNDCKDHLSDVRTVEDIDNNIKQLRVGKDYFFDEKRREWAQGIISMFSRMYSQINIECEQVKKGVYQCWLTMNGKPITCATIPKLKSDCAINLKCTLKDGKYLITYDDSDCISGEENIISLTLKVGSHTLKQKLHIQ